ncbi:putative transcription factor bZIP family [Helianthus anomalus]
MSNSSFLSADDHLSFNDFLDNILVNFPPQSPVMLSPGSDNSTKNTNSSSSGSEDGEPHKWTVNNIEDQRRKRLLSNRESARRSRKRKQKHLENITNQVTRYETGNQELVKRLWFVNHNGHMIRKENQRLRVESVRLQQRLYGLQQLLTNRPELQHSLLPSAWPCNNNVYVPIIN